MNDQTVVVTGAAGFIGRWVIKELLDRGHTVRGIDDLSNGSQRNLVAFDSNDRFTLTVGDVTDSDTVDPLSPVVIFLVG